MAAYLRPQSIEDALAQLQRRALTVVAGGTDFYPARVGQTLHEDVLDITALAGLRGIEARADHWRIGATTTWSDVIAAPLPPLFDGLKLAAREVGGVQIQNAGTLCGNVCNASPAADGVPALLSLGAQVEVSSQRARKLSPLSEFILGNRRTARAQDELVTALIVPKPARRAAGHFLKLGARKYLVISIVMVAAVVEVDDAGRVAAARVAMGACSPVAQCLPALEAALIGHVSSARLGEVALAQYLQALAPISDVRADAAYRSEAALVLLRRTLSELGAMLERQA